MTFRKTVLAYTGWLIVMPLYNRLLGAWRKREMANPSPSTLEWFDHQARALAEAMERRKGVSVMCPRCKMPRSIGGGHGPGMCIERRLVDVGSTADDAIVIDAARDAVRVFLAGPPLGEGDLGWALHALAGALDEHDDGVRS